MRTDKSLKEGTVSVNLIIGESKPIDGCIYSLNEVADALPIKPDTSFVLTLTQVPLQEDSVVSLLTLYTQKDKKNIRTIRRKLT